MRQDLSEELMMKRCARISTKALMCQTVKLAHHQAKSLFPLQQVSSVQLK